MQFELGYGKGTQALTAPDTLLRGVLLPNALEIPLRNGGARCGRAARW